MHVHVNLLAISNAEWINVCNFTRTAFGKSPSQQGDLLTRYLKTIEYFYSQRESYEHAYMTVGVSAPFNFIKSLYINDGLKISSTDEGDVVAIISASLSQWRQLFVKYLNQNSSKDERLFFGSVFLFLDTDYFEVVKDFQKVGLPDSTFIIHKRA